MFEDHLKRGHPIVFGLFTFFSLIEMIQTAVLVSSYNMHDDYPSMAIRDRTRFLLFVSVWTSIFSIFYLVGFMRSAGSFLFSIASHGAWLALTWIFWVAGAAAITNSLGGGIHCSNYPDLAHCNQLNSAEAFAWINFIIATFALVVIVFVGSKSARNGNGFGGALIV